MLRVQYTAAITHCSNVSVQIFLDNVLVQTTPFLAPGQSSELFDLSSQLPRRKPKLALQAVGQVGGCNAGRLASWAGTLHLETQ